LTDESNAQRAVRLAASRAGCRLWRNNVGAGKLENGSFVRWGLANESVQMNRVLKSADLIGIRPVVITAAHVGMTLGQFLSREVKHPQWSYRGDDHERAQRAWIDLVVDLGGDAAFTTGAFQ
jgi:hypothetical protein